MRSAYLVGKCDIAVQRETPEWGSQLDNSSEKSERSQLLVSEHQCWHDPPTCCCSVASRLWLGHVECGKGCSVLTATLWWCIDDHSAIQLHSPPSDLKEFPDWTLWAQQLVVLHLIEMFSSTLFFPFEKKLYIVTVEKKYTSFLQPSTCRWGFILYGLFMQPEHWEMCCNSKQRLTFSLLGDPS